MIINENTRISERNRRKFKNRFRKKMRRFWILLLDELPVPQIVNSCLDKNFYTIELMY